MKNITIIILNYNTKKLTSDLLKSVLRSKTKVDYQVVVVDNASTDGSVEEIKAKFPKIRLIKNKKNIGFAAGNNVAIRKYINFSEYIFLLNSDTILFPDTIDNLYKEAQKRNYKIFSCKLLNKDKSFQPNAGRSPNLLNVFLWLSNLDNFLGISSYQATQKSYYKNNREAGWVSGSAIMISSEVFKEVGLLDEKIFMYGEDVEFCVRAKKKGFPINWTSNAKLIHFGGASSRTPKYSQWLGEFNGLMYVYKKHFGSLSKIILLLLIKFFVALRMIAFYVVGRRTYAKTYAKIFKAI